jgi:ABC-type oligopeptide transport system substrate-binding subunit
MYSKSRFDRVNYNNPDFDRIIDQANAAPTESQRIAIYHKAEEVAVQSAAMIPVFFSRTALLKKPYIQGLELAPWAPGYLPPANVTIQR